MATQDDYHVCFEEWIRQRGLYWDAASKMREQERRLMNLAIANRDFHLLRLNMTAVRRKAEAK